MFIWLFVYLYSFLILLFILLSKYFRLHSSGLRVVFSLISQYVSNFFELLNNKVRFT